MKKIEKLTKEQQDQMPIYRDKWLDIGLSTKPADRALAEEGIKEAYKIAGLAEPRIVWCGSPMSNALTRAFVFEMKDNKEIGKKVRASVWDSVWASVGDSVWASVGDSVWDSVWDSVRDSVWASVGDSVGDSVWASVGDSVWDSVWDSVRDSVWDSVWASVGASVWASVRDSVGASVWDSVWASVGASVRDSVGDSVGASGYGQHDASWLAFYEYFKDATNLIEETKKLEGLWKIAKSAGWYIPHEKICWIAERPTELHRDNRGRLHNDSGMALRYPDGWGIYAVHGVRVDGWIIEQPETITVEKIEKEQNAEIRRVMINKYGAVRYMQDSGAKEVHRDRDTKEERILYRKETKGQIIQVVKVINSTPEPDGSKKEYHLRVPPEVKTAHEAVAWTFGLQAHEYHPVMET